MANPDVEERPSTSAGITTGSSSSAGDSTTVDPELRKRGAESETTSSSNTRTGTSKDSETDNEDSSEDAKAFECNICLDVAKDAVVSHCGHLFCWPCLHQWLETRPTRQSCPVCKAAISRDKVIPLYGRGGSGKDPRSKIPPRPTPTRQEQPDNNRFTWGGNGDGGAGSFHLSFGIGAFPFGFFASAFNWGQPTQAGMNNINVQFDEQEFLSKIFLWVAIIFIVWLLLA